jgi:HlyD family secretion protein
VSLQLFSKPRNRWFGLLILVGTVTGGFIYFSGIRSSQNVSLQILDVTPTIRKITALGRLEPQTEIMKLAAPVNLDGDRIAEILVKQGEKVKKGQVIAILDSRDRLQSALTEAQQRINLFQAQLDKVNVGAKLGEINSQKAKVTKLQAELQGEIATQEAGITRLKLELSNAEVELNRYQKLSAEGAIANSILDSKRLTMETASARLREAISSQNRTMTTLQAQINEARATLSGIMEIRPVDIQIAQTELDSAIAAANRARIELNQAYIKAPVDGQMIKVHGRLGEKIGDNGIADFGQTAQMVAVAEIYQTEISQIRIGQTAIVTSPAFTGELKAKVSDIGLQVSRQNVFANQPGENMDRRVVEVKVLINPQDSQKVAGLTNLQVQVAIAPKSIIETSN